MTETKRTTKIIELTFDYVVIHTGYIGRTVSHFLDHGYAFKLECYESRCYTQGGPIRDEKKDVVLRRQSVDEYEEALKAVLEADPAFPQLDMMYRRKYDNEPKYEREDAESEEDVRRAYPPLFIHDTHCGEGLYIRSDADTKEVTLVKKCVEEYRLGASNGAIAFHCHNLSEAFDMADKLHELYHCACFSPRHPMNVVLLEDEGGKRVLYLEYDCESG